MGFFGWHKKRTKFQWTETEKLETGSIPPKKEKYQDTACRVKRILQTKINISDEDILGTIILFFILFKYIQQAEAQK